LNQLRHLQDTHSSILKKNGLYGLTFSIFNDPDFETIIENAASESDFKCQEYCFVTDGWSSNNTSKYIRIIINYRINNDYISEFLGIYNVPNEQSETIKDFYKTCFYYNRWSQKYDIIYNYVRCIIYNLFLS